MKSSKSLQIQPILPEAFIIDESKQKDIRYDEELVYLPVEEEFIKPTEENKQTVITIEF